MDEKDAAAAERNKTASGAPPIMESKQERGAPEHPKAQANLPKVEQGPAEEKMSGFERSTLRWTRASFVVIALTGLFISLQWLEMRSGGIDTHALAESAKEQAQLTLAQQVQNLRALRSAEAQAAAAKRLADISAEQLKGNKVAMDASIAAFRLNERAWVGLQGGPKANFTLLPTLGTQSFQPVFVIGNSGRTPAFQVGGWIYSEIVSQGQHPKLEYRDFLGSFTLHPGNTIDLRPNSIKISGWDLEMLHNGVKVLYVVANITYLDAFNGRRHTHFCVFLQPSMNNLSACDFFQEAN